LVTVETSSVERTEEVRRLRAAVAVLPTVQREAVELVKFKELSLKEAAASSGRSEAALNAAVHRAVKRLRTILEEDEGLTSPLVSNPDMLLV
jgi:RNA polymerase sigma-70 factor, ECF subfamily